MESEQARVDGIDPIPTVNANDAIQDRVKRFILEQHLGAGSRLPPEGRLAQSLRISRPARGGAASPHIPSCQFWRSRQSFWPS